MAVLKCKMCGGDLNVIGSEKVVECEYCGSQQTIPDASDEKKVNLFNRANRLRISSEFDRAGAIYEQIIAEFPEEAEAYWGLCLCNFGIEYVDDPATAKKIPTCHRASFEKMRKDENYRLALENAEMSARIVYEDQAKEIDRIMSGILSVSKDEKPYDIFICYKETDRNGARTPDSVLAQDIYDALTAKNYRIFFSRITLEDKLGTQYEPYIFSALNSAKVMLVVGTDYEYMNAVWVKNEWSRFLKLMAKDKSKMLIPCYRDMDAYDMPDAFKGLQSQDCGKLGFMQDLTRGIDKLFGRTEKKEQQQVIEKVIVQQNAATASVDSLLKRVFLFLEDGNFDEADKYCEKVLDIQPECGEAYLGKLMVEMKVTKQEDLKNCSKTFDDSKHYQKLIRFADPVLSTTLSEYISHINERNEIERLTKIYNNALNMMKMAQNEETYRNAKSMFETISNFKDANLLVDICSQKIEELNNKELKYQDAKKLFNSAKTLEEMQKAKSIFDTILNYKNCTEYSHKCDCFCPVKLRLLDSRNILAPADGSIYAITLRGKLKREQLKIIAAKGVVTETILLPFDDYDCLIELFGWNDINCEKNLCSNVHFTLSISNNKEKTITIKRKFNPTIVIEN